jgi:hypothetical protein
MKGLRFVPEMAVAACEGRKTVTRRVIVPQPPDPLGGATVRHCAGRVWIAQDLGGETQSVVACDYVAGERRCLLTTWATHRVADGLKPSELPFLTIRGRPEEGFWHAGMNVPKPAWAGKSRPGMFLPNHLRHLMPVFEIVSVRAERVQDITEEDAIAEGVSNKGVFAELWESINAARGYGWAGNPFVWRVEFRKANQ